MFWALGSGFRGDCGLGKFRPLQGCMVVGFRKNDFTIGLDLGFVMRD